MRDGRDRLEARGELDRVAVPESLDDLAAVHGGEVRVFEQGRDEGGRFGHVLGGEDAVEDVIGQERLDGGAVVGRDSLTGGRLQQLAEGVVRRRQDGDVARLGQLLDEIREQLEVGCQVRQLGRAGQQLGEVRGALALRGRGRQEARQGEMLQLHLRRSIRNRGSSVGEVWYVVVRWRRKRAVEVSTSVRGGGGGGGRHREVL